MENRLRHALAADAEAIVTLVAVSARSLQSSSRASWALGDDFDLTAGVFFSL